MLHGFIFSDGTRKMADLKVQRALINIRLHQRKKHKKQSTCIVLFRVLLNNLLCPMNFYFIFKKCPPTVFLKDLTVRTKVTSIDEVMFLVNLFTCLSDC